MPLLLGGAAEDEARAALALQVETSPLPNITSLVRSTEREA